MNTPHHRLRTSAVIRLSIVGTLAGCAATGDRTDARAQGRAQGSANDRAEIVRLSEQLFEALATRDADLARSFTLPGGVLVSVRGEPGERRVGSTTSLDEYFTGTPLVRIEGDVAMLWGPYALDTDGQRSHTGTDILTFVRTDDGWRMATITYDVVPPAE